MLARTVAPVLLVLLLATATDPVSAAKPGSAATAAAGYQLELDIVGRGAVTWTVSGMACDRSCLTDLPPGTVVQLTAVPETGWVLDRLTGCTADPGDPAGTTCRVTMTRDTVIGATFVAAGPAVLAPRITDVSLRPRSIRPGTRNVRLQFTTDQGGIARLTIARCSKGTTSRCERYTVARRTRRTVRAGVTRVDVPTQTLRPGTYRVRLTVVGHSGRSNGPAVQRSLVVRRPR